MEKDINFYKFHAKRYAGLIEMNPAETDKKKYYQVHFSDFLSLYYMI